MPCGSCERTGITQETLAFKLDVCTDFLGDLERGKRDARWHTIRKVLRAIGAGPTELGKAIDREA